ncbi:hypothetical protein GL50803_0061706 [Giardia duodenalis]|uniref:Uncharacterized protein n=1 Tax=Giardia intestinalis (strain ATCC 50803 / WB clone C6) TaxID=184922 RepID=A0A644EZF6_GIAIC|nr:hypothetical protein GL50803_0061706 [Giardia intestinalis]KAE8301725.1 hypothetical protein GL50803_0061706 [Giardia intestinalis]
MSSLSNRPSAFGRTKEKRAVNDSLSIYLEDQTHPTLLVNPQKKVQKVSTKRADIPSYREIQTYRPPNAPSRALSKPKKSSSTQKSNSPAAIYSKSASTGRRGPFTRRASGRRTQSTNGNRLVIGRSDDNGFQRTRSPAARASTSPYYLRDSVDTLATSPGIDGPFSVQSAAALIQNDKSEIDIDPNIFGYHEPRRASRSTLRNDTKAIRTNGLFHVPLPSQQPPNRSNSGYESTLSHRMYSPIAPHHHSTTDSSMSRSGSQLGHHPKSTIKTDDIRERVRLQQNAAQALLRDYVFLVGYNPKYLSKSMLADGYQEAREIGEGHLHGEELIKKEKKLLGNIIGDIVHLRSGGHSGTGPHMIMPSLHGDTYTTMSTAEHLPPIDEEDLQIDDVIGVSKDDKGLQGDAANMVDASVLTDIERISCVHNEIVHTKDESTQNNPEGSVSPQPTHHNYKSPGFLKPSHPSTLHIKIDSPDHLDASESQGRTQISVITEPEVSETLSQNPTLLIRPVTENNDPSTKDLHNILDKAVHNDALKQARRESRSAKPPTTASLYTKDDTPGRTHRVTTSARTPTRERCDFAYHIPALSGVHCSRPDRSAPKTPNRRVSDNINAYVIDKRQEPLVHEISDGSSGISGIDGEINGEKAHASIETSNQPRRNISSGNRPIRAMQTNSAINTPVGMVRTHGLESSPTPLHQNCSLCYEPLCVKPNARDKTSKSSTDRFKTVRDSDLMNTICTTCYPKFLNSVIHLPLNDKECSTNTHLPPHFGHSFGDLEDFPADLITTCRFSNSTPGAIINLEACKACPHYKQTMENPHSKATMEKLADTLRSIEFHTRLDDGSSIAYFNTNVPSTESDPCAHEAFGRGAVPTYDTDNKEKLVTNNFGALQIDVVDDHTAMHDISVAMQNWGITGTVDSSCNRPRTDLRYACPFLTVSNIFSFRMTHKEPHEPPKPYSMVSSCPENVLIVTPIEWPPGEGSPEPELPSVALPQTNPNCSSDKSTIDFGMGTSHSAYPNKSTRKSQKIHTNVIDVTHTYDYNVIRNPGTALTQDEQTEVVLNCVSEAVQTAKIDQLLGGLSEHSLVDKINSKDIKKRVKKYLDLLDLKVPVCTSKDPTRCLCRICVTTKETVREVKIKHK